MADSAGSSTEARAQRGRRQRLASLCQRAGLMPLGRAVRQLLRHDVRILAYHRVLESAEPDAFVFDPELISASAGMFRKQMQLVRRRFHPLRFDELLDCIDRGRAPPPRSVLVTFDDGYDDNYRIAWPILQEAGLSAMFFVSTGHIDSGAPYAYDWLAHMLTVAPGGELALPEIGLQARLHGPPAARREVVAQVLDRLKALDAAAQEALIGRLEEVLAMPRAGGHDDCRPMSWDQLRRMHASGMEIGSHGVNHRMLAKLSPALIEEELAGSRQAIGREIGIHAQVLSYPVGGLDAYDGTVVDIARASGYRLACSYISGTSGLEPANRYGMPRLPVERHMDLGWFEAMLSLPEVFSHTSRNRGH